MFDWPTFLQSHNIEFRTRGPNVAKSNIAILCPLCGGADTGFHMGISLIGKGWGCWRDRDHRGGSDTYLVQLLLRCSRERAAAITGADVPMPSGYMQAVTDMNAEGEIAVIPKRKLQMPAEFQKLGELVSARPFLDYLRKRGFNSAHVARMTGQHGMRYASRGSFKGRIIFPVHFEGRLCTWTGRSTYPSATLRYKTLTQDVEKAMLEGCKPALGPIGDYLLWYDELFDVDADTICIVEGPFDALKIDVLGARHGVCATCFFTSQPTDNQVDLMHALLPRFKRRVLIPDQNAEVMGMKTRARLRALEVDIRMMPAGIDDPGEFDRKSLLEFMAL